MVSAYYRVSTGRQAEQDLSIPDQQKQISAWCLARGWKLVAEFIEPGASPWTAVPLLSQPALASHARGC
jgi:DNA invertase Pin-like site-specific DNA recombinase